MSFTCCPALWTTNKTCRANGTIAPWGKVNYGLRMVKAGQNQGLKAMRKTVFVACLRLVPKMGLVGRTEARD